MRLDSSSRLAKAVVNNCGMCWTITVPGVSPGRCAITARSASVPPVEAPIARIWLVVRRIGGGFSSLASGRKAGRGPRLRAAAAERMARARAGIASPIE